MVESKGRKHGAKARTARSAFENLARPTVCFMPHLVLLIALLLLGLPMLLRQMLRIWLLLWPPLHVLLPLPTTPPIVSLPRVLTIPQNLWCLLARL